MPLVIASGAAAVRRRDVGTPVFAGMLAASCVGIFVIPMLYVTFQTMRERTGAMFRRKTAEPHAPAEREEEGPKNKPSWIGPLSTS